VTSLRSIGAVVTELSEEFEDITASKIRYLEAEGLVEPLRTPRGSRRYAEADVDRLRRILRLQRDEFLPLAVIAQRLSAPDQPVVGPTTSVPATRLRPPRPRRMTAAEVASRAGVDRATLDELVDHGLVVEMDSGAVEVCTLIVRLGEFGIEPRHLRSFKVAADREVGLVQQALAPRRGSVSPVEARDMTSRLLALLLDLHVALVRQRSSTLES